MWVALSLWLTTALCCAAPASLLEVLCGSNLGPLTDKRGVVIVFRQDSSPIQLALSQLEFSQSYNMGSGNKQPEPRERRRGPPHLMAS